jgi:hypothetical protein
MNLKTSHPQVLICCSLRHSFTVEVAFEGRAKAGWLESFRR